MDAKDLFKNIGYGKRNAVSRPPNARIDRAFRKLIEQANAAGDCIIPSEVGYYRPNTPAEYREAEVYFKKRNAPYRRDRAKDTKHETGIEKR